MTLRREIVIRLGADGVRDILLQAETERDCKELIDLYQHFEPDILDFICSTARRAKKEPCPEQAAA